MVVETSTHLAGSSGGNETLLPGLFVLLTLLKESLRDFNVLRLRYTSELPDRQGGPGVGLTWTDGTLWIFTFSSAQRSRQT